MKINLSYLSFFAIKLKIKENSRKLSCLDSISKHILARFNLPIDVILRKIDKIV